jgi:phage tail protein X
MKRLTNYIAWYKKLRNQGYNRLDSLSWAVYNSKHYTIEGIYK